MPKLRECKVLKDRASQSAGIIKKKEQYDSRGYFLPEMPQQAPAENILCFFK
ncbi:hypothetical protein BRYFOR_05356 [Marvinbryantia formatexigens DSM 14469]|uniref:Uncharacterized protein n=1 Tax=Marvinbryantia formatexigens DSM 14469 TaxID=478749 RepID=C6L9R6_9FIRM|nr:hypothetical protein BRYFOR_05356 [Marvinbryantia formatexigens DSM 14469]